MKLEGPRHLPKEYEIGGPTAYFAVPLDGSKIDTFAFDYKVSELQTNFSAKFIVAKELPQDEKVEDVLYVFHPRRSHANFVHDFNETQGVGELQSAGHVKLDSGYGGVEKREFYGHSDTLEKAFGLTKEQSDTYKLETLRSKLGSNFNVR